MRLAPTVLPLALALVGPGCATLPTVVPENGASVAQSPPGPISLRVFPSAWEGEPDDLAAYVTPVAVEIVNDGPEPVRVSYFDFALTDERGNRYAAINPFVDGEEPPPSSSAAPERLPAGALATSDLRPGMLLARGGGGFHGGGFHGGGVHFAPAPTLRRGGAVRVGPGYGARLGPGPRYGASVRYGWGVGHGAPRPIVRSGVYLGPPGWHGYAVLPFYRPWFGVGLGYGYFGDPFYWPAAYATWVWAWSPAYYPSETPPPDLVTYGLPEGVLEPGGHASGFLYFQHVSPSSARLTLAYDAVSTQSGGSVARPQVALDVRR